MKTRLIWVLLSAICFFSCDDNTGSIGMGMLEENEKITVKTTTYPVTTQSVISGPVFAKTNIGYLGRFSDPEFGYYEAGFLAQLNCTDSLQFPAVYNRETKTGHMTGDSILYAELILFYDKGGYFGDSLNTSHLSVYELNKTLEKKESHYTDIDPTQYFNPNDLLAEKAYTAVDLSVSESDRNSSSYSPHVRLRLPEELGNRIYRTNREHPEYYYHSDDFIENVLKGIYVKNDLGDGTVLYISEIDIRVYFPCFQLDSLGNIVKNSANRDSIYITNKSFISTKEVIQANQFTNSELLEERAKETDHTYIKSPAGLFTQVTLPIQDVADELKNDTLNYVNITFTNYAQNNTNQFSMSAPYELLLIREKEYKEFFEENKLPDNITSFVVRHSSSTNEYTYSNITRLVNTCISEKEAAKKAAGSSWNEAAWEEENKWDKVLLIPVKITSEYNSSTGYETFISVHHNLQPTYAKMKGGEKDILTLEVGYTHFLE